MKKWKSLFFMLLAMNLLIVMAAGILMLIPGDQSASKKAASSEYSFDISSSKESLTSFVNDYLKNQGSSNMPDFHVAIDQDVKVTGAIKAFSSTIDANVSFTPSVEENGDVLLKVDDFSIGQLSIPISFVLSYMGRFYELPEFVHVKPDQKTIEVRLSEMPLTNGMYVKANKIDLENDDIEFSYYHPQQ
ncbi:YpmS family protein [Bacillus sp. 179-C3.3 HS]|uniref:YpmS family protein n=1 Tax=Bacillus sp. 179-C3.3 HS TaxID=3232162 RepID=UPI0039A29125